MSKIAEFITDIKSLKTLSEKTQLLSALLASQGKRKVIFSPEDKTAIHSFAFEELDHFLNIIPTCANYKEKNELFCYQDCIFGLIMLCHPSPSELTNDELFMIKNAQELIEKERFIEMTIDSIFEQGNRDPENVKHLLGLLVAIHDEFQKSQLYHGLLHYRAQIRLLPTESKAMFGDYIFSEIERYLSAPISEDTVNYLELACDICKHFISDSTAPILYKIFELGKNNISFYAVETLITAKKSVPNEVIYALAGDIEYAELTYSVLKSHKLLHLFPAEFSNEEYLAKSNLTRWLLYPTELGKLPDKIEYLGKVKKKEVFHILRFTSDSDNLEDALKGKWLIGWASEDGGTFSNFDLYENFEQKTLDKTLKFIKKKLL